MAIAVFDTDVLIAFLSRDEPQHDRAVRRVRGALEPGTRRLVSAVSYAELLIGPLRAGGAVAAERIDATLARLGFETVSMDMGLARAAASVRSHAALKLPDAFVVATALHAETLDGGDARIESFDRRVNRAFAALRRPGRA